MANGYIDIDGHPTWVEDTGTDQPAAVLLHGAFSATDLLNGVLLDALSSTHRVVAFDRKAHGRTADTDAPLHYETMADETVGVLRDVVAGPADLVGYSDGANVALITAMKVPDLIRSLVLIGANYRADGVIEGAVDATPGDPFYAVLESMYGAVSPDGAEHFAVVAEKTMTMIHNEPTMSEADLESISAPALVISGDDDAIHLEHTIALYRALPNSRLAVVPGASHLFPLEKPAHLAALVTEFLADLSPPTTMMPVRRA